MVYRQNKEFSNKVKIFTNALEKQNGEVERLNGIKLSLEAKVQQYEFNTKAKVFNHKIL